MADEHTPLQLFLSPTSSMSRRSADFEIPAEMEKAMERRLLGGGASDSNGALSVQGAGNTSVFVPVTPPKGRAQAAHGAPVLNEGSLSNDVSLGSAPSNEDSRGKPAATPPPATRQTLLSGSSNSNSAKFAIPNGRVGSPSPSRKRARFTPAEDARIAEGVQRHGSDWERIVQEMGLERSGPAVSRRWKKIKTKAAAAAAATTTSGTSTGTSTASSAHAGSASAAAGGAGVSATSPKLTAASWSVANSRSGKKGKQAPSQPAPPTAIIIHDDGSPKSVPTTTTSSSSTTSTTTAAATPTPTPTPTHTPTPTPATAEGPAVVALRADNARLRETLAAAEARVETVRVAAANDQVRMRAALMRMVVKMAKQERADARARMREAAVRLGRVTVDVGPFGRQQTVWENGSAFLALKQAEHALADETERVTAAKRAVSRQKTALREQGGQALAEALGKEEVLKLRLLQLRKDKDQLAAERSKLEVEKNLSIKEYKRIRAEDASQYTVGTLFHKRYVLTKLLGKGGFSEVHKAFDIVELREVACKVLQLNARWTDEKKANYMRHATREYHIHKSLNHPRIVRLFDVFEINANAFCTVLELCEGPDLDVYLKTHHQSISEREAKAVMLQVFSGLQYLSQQKPRIIHYDLKPANVLMGDGGANIKLTDFGLSKQIEDDVTHMELTSQGAGTYWYLPPECFEMGSPVISPALDVWSAGVILYQMLYGRRPFGDGMTQAKILKDGVITNAGDVQFPSRPSVSADCKAFVRKCLSRDPAARPNILAIFDEPWLSVKKK